MALLKCNRHWSNSWSTTNVLAFAQGWAKGKLGGFCWRFLSTKSNHQLRSKKEKTNMIYTHILFIFTKFHLCCKNIVLQDTYKNTVEIWSKVRNLEGITQTLQAQINKLIAHIHLLLIYFHMYWIPSILQHIYMKYMGSMVKVRKPESVK